MNTDDIKNEEEFRDHIGTVNPDGSRKWVYPKKPAGTFHNYRVWFSGLLLALLIGLPFIKVNGDPLFLLNILERNFILFGIVFTPQDMHLFALAMVTFMVFIILFTVVFGRLFCGWACPQTIFMEMVFRKIEYWIEGDANQQKKLNKAPWTNKKIFKKSLKHVIFFAIALFIANIFLSYIVGVDQVRNIISEPISQHLGGFFAMLVFSGLFYGVFAFFREQVCIAVCPYGRLQGVLLVKSSIVVIYDWVRGEPRGRIKKKRKKDNFIELPLADPPVQIVVQKKDTPHAASLLSATSISMLTDVEKPIGDCVECNLCVAVCPTGIDIRNGTQLECVNCTACMDACDEVMDKIGREKGLIRYDSHENISTGVKEIFNKRVMAYAAVLIGLVVFQGYLLGTRTDVETILLRTPGMLYQELEDNQIGNLYNYQLINKTKGVVSDIEFKLVSGEGRIRIVGEVPDVMKQEVVKGSLFIEMNADKLNNRKTKLEIEIYSDGKLIDRVKTNFLGPVK